jgi:uncharacterized protein
MSVIATTLALIIGLTLGLLGGGGSILTVPAFVYALGYDPKVAIVMSLPVVGGASLVGATRHAMLGNVSLRVALPFGAAAMVGAFVGAKLAYLISGTTQLVLLALVMLAAAISMLRNAKLPEHAIGAPDRPTLGLLAIGVAGGMLTGIVGVGGGFLIVPALVVLGGVPMRQAVGTSLVVIAMNTLAGYAGYHGTVDVPWLMVLQFGGVAALGILIGSVLLKRVPQQMLKRAFAVLLLFIGVLILWQNRSLV